MERIATILYERDPALYEDARKFVEWVEEEADNLWSYPEPEILATLGDAVNFINAILNCDGISKAKNENESEVVF